MNKTYSKIESILFKPLINKSKNSIRRVLAKKTRNTHFVFFYSITIISFQCKLRNRRFRKIRQVLFDISLSICVMELGLKAFFDGIPYLYNLPVMYSYCAW